MRVVTLFARHGSEWYANALEDLRAWFEHRLPELEHDLVVVDNSLPPDHEESVHGGLLLGSSNAHWEFSAWDRALDYLGSRVEEYEFVHLATSAFRSLYVDYLDRFNPDMLELVAGRRAAVGHIDYYNEPVSLFGCSLQAWVRSSCVFLSAPEVRRLGTLVSVADTEMLFSGDPRAPFLLGAPISANYQKYILDWLTGPGTGQGVEWHSRFCLTPETRAYFEAKAGAILNEQMLSYRLREQGCALVDATWLDTRRIELAPGRSLGEIPDWRRQITSRDCNPAPRRLADQLAAVGVASRLHALFSRMHTRGALVPSADGESASSNFGRSDC
jgi:hypothetical protein